MWNIFAKIMFVVGNIITTGFGIYCLFNGRYVEALLCGILIELRCPERYDTEIK